MTKRAFLVVDDYGQGGIWGWVTAPSRAEIESRFPELKVFEEAPDWFTEADLAGLEIEDIDGPYTFLLKSILQTRRRPPPQSS